MFTIPGNFDYDACVATMESAVILMLAERVRYINAKNNPDSTETERHRDKAAEGRARELHEASQCSIEAFGEQSPAHARHWPLFVRNVALATLPIQDGTCGTLGIGAGRREAHHLYLELEAISEEEWITKLAAAAGEESGAKRCALAIEGFIAGKTTKADLEAACEFAAYTVDDDDGAHKFATDAIAEAGRALLAENEADIAAATEEAWSNAFAAVIYAAEDATEDTATGENVTIEELRIIWWGIIEEFRQYYHLEGEYAS